MTRLGKHAVPEECCLRAVLVCSMFRTYLYVYQTGHLGTGWSAAHTSPHIEDLTIDGTALLPKFMAESL